MGNLKRQYRIHLLPPTHKDYGRDIPLEEEDLDVPQILLDTPFDSAISDYFLVREFHWTHEQIRSQPEAWLKKILLIHSVNNQIQNELMEPDGGHRQSERRQPSDVDIASARAMFPQMSVDDARRWLGGAN